MMSQQSLQKLRIKKSDERESLRERRSQEPHTQLVALLASCFANVAVRSKAYSTTTTTTTKSHTPKRSAPFVCQRQ